MSRTYASAVAGVTQKMSFDTSSHTFTLSYKITSACHSTATEVCVGCSNSIMQFLYRVGVVHISYTLMMKCIAGLNYDQQPD